MFLLELGTFYPFGCAINKKDEIKPLGVYLEEKNLLVPHLIDLLKNSIHEKLNDGEYSAYQLPEHPVSYLLPIALPLPITKNAL